MRYLGIVWGPGYPREQVGAVLPPIFSKGRPGWSFQKPAQVPGVIQLTDNSLLVFTESQYVIAVFDYFRRFETGNTVRPQR
jgi:hypothetical protein